MHNEDIIIIPNPFGVVAFTNNRFVLVVDRYRFPRSRERGNPHPDMRSITSRVTLYLVIEQNPSVVARFVVKADVREVRLHVFIMREVDVRGKVRQAG